jgi:hypothetical protein
MREREREKKSEREGDSYQLAVAVWSGPEGGGGFFSVAVVLEQRISEPLF